VYSSLTIISVEIVIAHTIGNLQKSYTCTAIPGNQRCVCVCAAGKIAEFVDGSPCSFVAVIDFAYMVYFNFFGCILPPLVVMVAIYSYIYSVVRRHIASIAVVMPPQVVVMATVQAQDPAVIHDVTTSTSTSQNVDVTVPATRQGKSKKVT